MMASWLYSMFPYFPRNFSERGALAFLVLMAPTVAAFELFFVIPHVYHDDPFNHGLHVAFIAWVWGNIALNLIFILRVNVSTMGRVLPAVLKPGWRFCSPCGTNSPPRSWHCSHCGFCVLKRDHHCGIVGGCVGFQNHRYYLGLIGYLWLATLYANIMNFDYVWEELGTLGFKAVVAISLPIIAWMIGLVPHFSFLVALITAVCGLSFLWLSTLMVHHIRCVTHNQTTMERAQGTRRYDLGRSANVETVLGSRWVLALLSPLVPSPLLGDGLEFPSKEFIGMRDSAKTI